MTTLSRFAVLLGLAATLALVPAASGGPGTPVLATRLLEADAVAGGGFLAWAQNSRKHPRLYKLHARYRNGQPFLIHRRYQSFPGSISGNVLTYHAFSLDQGLSTIYFYDLKRRRQLPVPRGINTSLFEWRPSLSGDWLLYSRNDGDEEAVKLYNLRTKSQIELDRGRMRDDENYGIPGQVNGNFAVWTRCPRSRTRPCTVLRYNVASKTKTELAPPEGFDHFAPSVAADGTTYLVRHEPQCSLTELWRYPLEGAPAAIFGPMPIGRGITTTYVESRVGPNGPVNDVYHARISCLESRSDLWRLTD